MARFKTRIKTRETRPAADEREMRGVWLHLLRLSFRRGWYWFLTPALVLLFFSSFGQSAEPEVILFLSLFLIFSPIGGFVRAQGGARRLLASLPLSRTTRGRFIWLQYIGIVPVCFYGEVMLLAALAALSGRATAPFFSLFNLAGIAFALGGLAAAFVLFRRNPLGNASLLAGVIPVMLMILALGRGRGIEEVVAADSPLLLVVLAASLLVIGVSWHVAPRALAIAAESKTVPAIRRLRRKEPSTSPRPGVIGPLYNFVLAAPLQLILIGLAGLALIRFEFIADAHDADLAVSMLIPFVSVAIFVLDGMTAMKRARLLRMLPLRGGRLAALIIAHGVATALLVGVVAAAFVRAAMPGVSLANIANPVLLSICVGCFIPVFVMSCSDFLGPAYLYEGFALFMILFNNLAYGVSSHYLLPLPVLLVAVPVCALAAVYFLRNALLYENAYQYREPLDSAAGESS